MTGQVRAETSTVTGQEGHKKTEADTEAMWPRAGERWATTGHQEEAGGTLP